MPENFVYVRILQMIADPRLREDDEGGTSPEPAPACAEQSRSKQGRMGEDDEGRW